VGTGNQKEHLDNYAKKNKLSNVTFHGQRPWEELQQIYSQTTILYAQLTKDYDSAVPSKLYEYASTGLPVIYGGVGESKNFIAKLENALCIEPDNIEQLIEAIKVFQTKNFSKSTKNQRFIEENFVREKVNLKFLDIVQENFIHEKVTLQSLKTIH
jgi:glycosyltransferase involved in cell wall biosynthesis